MKLEYDEIKSIQEENVPYEKDGELLTANLMITEYVPKSFEGTTKNFCLRENHDASIELHNNFKSRCMTEWLEELGYDITKYKVNIETSEIVSIETDYVYSYSIENLKTNESTEI